MVNGQFLPDYFKFLHYTVLPQWPKQFIIAVDGKERNIILLLQRAFTNAIIADYPLEHLFPTSKIIVDDDGQVVIDNVIYDIDHSLVGPNNLKYTKFTIDDILSNFRTSMVVDMLSLDGEYYIDQVIYPRDIYLDIPQPGIEVVKYLVEERGADVIPDDIATAGVNLQLTPVTEREPLRYGNWNIAMYLFDHLNGQQIPTPGYINGDVTLEGLRTIYHIYPSVARMDNVVSHIYNMKTILGGDDDNPECLEFIYSVLGYYDLFFTERLIPEMVKLDNIRCLATVMNIPTSSMKLEGNVLTVIGGYTGDIVDKIVLSDGQRERLKHY